MLETRCQHLTSGGPRLEGEPNILKQDTLWTELTFYLEASTYHVIGQGGRGLVTLLNKLI